MPIDGQIGVLKEKKKHFNIYITNRRWLGKVRGEHTLHNFLCNVVNNVTNFKLK